MMPLWWAITRAAHFGACMTLLAVCVFDRLVATGGVREQWLPIARRLILIALPLALLSGAAWLALNAIDMSGLPLAQALTTDVLGVVWDQTQFGTVWKWRAIGFLPLALAFAPLLFRRRPWLLAMLLSAAFVATLAWAGHGVTGSHPAWHLPADIVHLLCASAWPTGLLPFTWLLFKLRRDDDIATLTRRFSAASLAAVIVLTATGLANSFFLLGGMSRLFTTSYGQLLVVKVSLFLVMVALGAMNLLFLKPRISAGVSQERATRLLRMNVSVEVALAMLVVLIVAVLGRLPPD